MKPPLSRTERIDDDMLQHEDVLQIQNHVANLAHQIERTQWEVERLLQETQEGNAQLHALTQHFLKTESRDRLNETLAELQTQMDSSQEKIDELVQTVKKLSRTQFKANTLNESKEQQTSEAVALLREMLTKREQVQEAQQQEEKAYQAVLQGRARAEFAADFLPVLDGIELALEHGISLPSASATQASSSEKPPGFFRKLFGRGPSPEPVEGTFQDQDQKSEMFSEISDTMTGWLHGLEIVRERFLRLFEQEGITRIPDLHESFDPHLHVALEIEERDDVPDNTIIKVIRKGYTHHDRVLRYAEVIVAKTPQHQSSI